MQKGGARGAQAPDPFTYVLNLPFWQGCIKKWLKFQENFTEVKGKAESIAIDLNSVIIRYGRRGKIHEKYKYSAKIQV